MKKSLIFVLLMTMSCPIWAADPLAVPGKLAPDIKHGELANGLRYFLKPNQKGQAGGEIELRLLVNSGSIDEADNERGIAHLIEHMAFRRTKHFAAHEIKDFFNSNGMQFGNDSNAATGFETTTYIFKVKKESLDRGLQLLADWANGDIQFDENELQLERQIVLDEKKLRLVDEMGWRNLLGVAYPKSVYIDRFPIGAEESIKALPLAQVEALYKKLYQPQKISLIASGDLPEDMLLKVKKLFSQSSRGDALVQQAPHALTPEIRLFKGVPPWPQQAAAVSWSYKLAPNGDDVEQQLQAITMYCLQQRLQKMAIAGDMFSSAQSLDLTGAIGRERYLMLSATAKDAEVDALRALYREIQRANLHGFSAEEISAARQDFAKAALGWAQTPAQWANSLVDTARFGTQTLGHVHGPEWFRGLTINPQTVNSAWQRLNATPDQMAMLMSYPSRGVVYAKFEQEQLLEMIKSVQVESVLPIAQATSKPLMSVEPLRGRIKSNETINGAKFLTLSNGAQVMLRLRRQANEHIGISGVFEGGMFAIPKEQQSAGLVLPVYQQLAGLGDLTQPEVAQALRTSDMQISTWVGVDQHGFSGVSSDSNAALTTVMQFIHQLMRYAPHSASDTVKKSVDLANANYWKNGGPGLNQNVFTTAWPYQVWLEDGDFNVSQAQLDALHQQLFGDPSQLKLVLTGIADIADANDLLERYIGSIPQPKTKQPTVAITPLKPHSGLEAKQLKPRFTHWTIAVDGAKPNTQNAFMAEALSSILKDRLWQVLREDKGDSYIVDAGYDLSSAQGLLIYLAHSSDDKSCQAALPLVANELKRISNTAVSDAELQTMRERMQKGLDNGPNVPYWYAKAQSRHWQWNADQAWLKLDPKQLLSREQVDAATKSWFVPSNWSIAAANCKPDMAALTAEANP